MKQEVKEMNDQLFHKLAQSLTTARTEVPLAHSETGTTTELFKP